jgi:hypothetical protein
MDSLTARYLARELDARWRGKHVAGCVFDREARSVLIGVEGEEAWVRVDLSTPEVTVAEALPVAVGKAGVIQGWTVRGVRAPVDDRRLVIELSRPGRFKGSAERRATLEVSAVPAARGAVLRDAGGARLTSLGAKLPPVAVPRPVLDDAAVAAAARAQDAERLLLGRWTSPAVVRWLIAEPERAVERYRMLDADVPPEPAWCGGRLVPFPMCADAEPARSLVVPLSFSTSAFRGPSHGVTARGGLAAPEPELTRAERARRRMREELDRAREAPRLRQAADELIALGDAPAPEAVTLPDGSSVSVGAKPGESAVVAAERLYGEVRSMERALEALPARIAALEPASPADDMGDKGSPSTRILAGGAPRPRAAAPAPRYRTYRSSGGIEIWVGRGAASNDELTFHASSPDDVWLHARGAAGAHVILRWQRDAAPPKRDLEEAAVLAAWHSKARGSTVVPVDWTRRKYVRKPRGAAPGAVVVQRSETVFVRPEGRVERRLRERA